MPKKGSWHNRPYSVSLYLPCRTAMILIPEENLSQEIRQRGQIEIPSIGTEPVAAARVIQETVKENPVEEEEKGETGTTAIDC